jgi:hypothetical protein
MSVNQQNADPESKNQQRAEELIAAVQGWLSQSEPFIDQSVEALRQVIALLDGDSTERAGEIRQRAGGFWCALCEEVPDLEVVQMLLSEGEQLFTGLPAAQRLGEMFESVEIVSGLRRALDLEPDQRQPTWLGQPEAIDRLAQLGEAFDVLDRSELWPNLQMQVEKCRQSFVHDLLDPYLVKLDQDARLQAQNKKFARALSTIEKANQLLSEQFPTQFLSTIDQDEVLLLKEALVTRQQAEVALWSAAVRLTSSDITFSQVLSEVDLDLPDHADVPVDDLVILLDDLNQVAKVEAVSLELSDAQYFVNGVHHSQNLTQVKLAIEDDLPAFLKEADAALTRKLRERMIGQLELFDRVYDDVALKLAQQIENQIQFIETDIDPTPLLSDYWRLCWCAESGLIKDPSLVSDVNEMLAKTRHSPSILAIRAAQIFENVRTDADLAYVNRILSAIGKLNEGLVKIPQVGENHQPLLNLPPLPDGAQFPEIAPRYDLGVLERWSRILGSWQNRVDEMPALEQTDIFEVGGIETVAEYVQGIIDDLKELKNIIWPEMDLPQWKEDSNPGRLEDEALLLLSFISVLQEAGRMWREEQAIDILVYLDELIVQAGHLDRLDEYTLWLLASPRHYLRSKFNEVYPIVVDGVHSQVRDLLDNPSRSTQQLQNEILIKPQSVESGEVLYKAIFSITDQLVGRELQSDQREEGTSLWRIIYEATRPWAGGRVKVEGYPELPGEVELLWQKLHRVARKARFKLAAMNRKREIAASCAILILLVVIMIGANVLFSQPSDGENQGGAVVLAPATEENTVTPANEAREAELTASAATDLARESIAQETAVARAGTGTAQAFVNQTTTQQAAISDLEKSTAQAIASTTAFQGTALAQASTATQSALASIATAEAIRCGNVTGYALELSSALDFDPPVGTEYIIDTETISPTVAWEVTNVGECKWERLEVRPASGEQEVRYALWREGEVTEVTPEDPLQNDETIQVILNFDVFESSNIDGEWVLVVNGLDLLEQPHLELDVEDWIILITPPSSRP